MENTGVICDVCACVHHSEDNKCTLPEIKVTEQADGFNQSVATPHFCQSFEAK